MRPTFIMTGKLVLPFCVTPITAGFPSPATDYAEDHIDLIEHLTPNRMASFVWRVEGRSMEGCGIHHGDLAIVDRSIQPRHSHIVVAVIDGGCTIKQLRYINGQPKLFALPENRQPYALRPHETFEVWGVVRHTLTSHLSQKQ